MESSQQQQQQQQDLLVNLIQDPQSNEILDSFVQSKKFISDPHIKNLIDKSITLGIQLENIKETLKRFMLQFLLKNNNLIIDFANLDFKQIIDETKFFDQLVLLSIQLDNSTSGSSKSASWIEDDYASNYDEPSDFSIDPIEKQKPKQQSFQEFYAQSLDRINDKSNLRPIIVDGSDVAQSGQNKQIFNLIRIKQVVEYFEKRNHQIYVILPQWRKEQIMSSLITPQTNNTVSNPTPIQNTQLNSDQMLLVEMEQKNQIHYSPSKRVGGKRIVCDDDSFILNLAVNKKGIIVSNDNFKRFLNQRDEFKQVIEERVLMYSFIDDTFIPAEDPLGKNGPSLDNFLRFESFTNQQYMKRCPYKKKCTYGSKCKFWHPERVNQSGQPFKTAFQSVLDQSQEQRMRLEIILNQPEESTMFSSGAAQKIIQTNLKQQIGTNNFVNKIDLISSQDSLIAKKMGPDTSQKLTLPSKQESSSTGFNLFNNQFNLGLQQQQQQQQLGNNGLKNQSSSSSSSNSSLNKHDVSKNSSEHLNNLNKQNLRAQLKTILNNEEKINQLMSKYQNETDTEKIIFLANQMSFDF